VASQPWNAACGTGGICFAWRTFPGATTMSKFSEDESVTDQQLEHRGYHVHVSANRDELGSWKARLDISRDGGRLDIDEPESIGPYWTTRQEAIRAGIERARYLLDRRDGLLQERNPARNP
jgi:hypothetical protein